MNGSPTPLPTAIEETARALLAARFPGADWTVMPKRVASRKSDLYFLAAKSERRVVAVKAYREHVGLGGTYGAQRDALTRFHPLMRGVESGFSVPELYGHDDSLRLLALEWVEAPTLTRVLVHNLINRWRQSEAIKLSASWLRRFHRVSGQETLPFDPSYFSTLLDRRVARHPDAAKRLARDPAFIAGRQFFDETGAALAGRPAIHTLSHGDFTPSNILISPRRVTGIDIWGQQKVPICTDMARMITYLLTTDLMPLRARFQPMPVEERPWFRAFLTGYGPDLIPDSSLLKHLILFQTLARWITLEDRIHERDKPFDNWRATGLKLLVRSFTEI